MFKLKVQSSANDGIFKNESLYNYKRGVMQVGQLIGMVMIGVMLLINIFYVFFTSGFYRRGIVNIDGENVCVYKDVGQVIIFSTALIILAIAAFIVMYRTKINLLIKNAFAEIVAFSGVLCLMWQYANVQEEGLLIPILTTMLVASQTAISPAPKYSIILYNTILGVFIIGITGLYDIPDSRIVNYTTVSILIMLTVVLCVIDSATQELFRMHKAVERQNITDALTGLYNRKGVDLFCNEDSSFAQSGAIVMLDIDHFKKVNDTHGHDVGDDILRSVASTLLHYKGYKDVAIRWGGEEFVVYLPDKNSEDSVAWAELLRQGIANGRNMPINITVSLGVTNCHKGEKFEPVVRRADHALYRAKNSGRNKTCSNIVVPETE